MERQRSMTQLLDAALTTVAELPDAEQDRIAQLMLDEIADEARWQATFAGSHDKLGRLAQRAPAEIACGEIGDDDPVDRRKGS